MEILKVTRDKNILLAVLVFAGIALRFLPHTPNFTAVGAVALVGGALLGWRAALLLPVVVMAVSDLFIGFYPGIAFTWLGFIGVAGFGMLFRRSSFLSRTLIGGLGGSVVFYLVSNFGVWAAGGMYPGTLAGLVECYIMAIPFFGATLGSSVLYSAVLFGAVSPWKQSDMIREKASSVVSLMIKYTHVKNH